MSETADPGPNPFLLGFLGPFAVFIVFTFGVAAIDRADPNTAGARIAYIATVAAAAAILVLLHRSLGRHGLSTVAIALGTALPFAYWISAAVQDSYGFTGFILVLLAATFGVPVLFVLGIATGIGAAAGSAMTAARIAAAGGGGICAGIGMAALYHIVTISEQADRAREAHESPAAFLLGGLLLLFLAAARRR